MMTVHEVSNLSGVSIRTLHYYDKIGLLHPSGFTESGYRLYDDTALERLQQILLFRELEFPLKTIMSILESDTFDRSKVLEQQIELLLLKKEHLENLIQFARELQTTGEKKMDFQVFDTAKIDEYKKRAKEQWGNTNAYREFEIKDKTRNDADNKTMFRGLMEIFHEFGQLSDKSPADAAVQAQVKKLQDYISNHFYTCTPSILSGLGKMYSASDEFKDNIDRAGGKGTAAFVTKAIEIFCR